MPRSPALVDGVSSNLPRRITFVSLGVVGSLLLYFLVSLVQV